MRHFLAKGNFNGQSSDRSMPKWHSGNSGRLRTGEEFSPARGPTGRQVPHFLLACQGNVKGRFELGSLPPHAFRQTVEDGPLSDFQTRLTDRSCGRGEASRGNNRP